VKNQKVSSTPPCRTMASCTRVQTKVCSCCENVCNSGDQCSYACSLQAVFASLTSVCSVSCARTKAAKRVIIARTSLVVSKNSRSFCLVTTGDLVAIRELVEVEGIDVNEKGASDRTALHRAAGANHVEIISYLLKNNATIDSKDRYQRTPLFWAAIGTHRMIKSHFASSAFRSGFSSFTSYEPSTVQLSPSLHFCNTLGTHRVSVARRQ
jgi:Ankyrin repeats (3 copies)